LTGACGVFDDPSELQSFYVDFKKLGLTEDQVGSDWNEGTWVLGILLDPYVEISDGIEVILDAWDPAGRFGYWRWYDRFAGLRSLYWGYVVRR
jgi:hypothetical protein